MEWYEWIRFGASAITPIAVLVAALQLRFNRGQARASFEDDLNREYRGITAELPLDAFSTDPDVTRALDPEERKAMFRYFDLSNEQLRIAADGKRIAGTTRDAWQDGIRQNMGLPRFRQEWAEMLQVLPDDFFTELSRLQPPAAVDAADVETLSLGEAGGPAAQ
jgi:hypothetical protein